MKATKFSQFLQNREELKFVDRPHWIYLVEALIWGILISIAGLYLHNFIGDYFIIPWLADDVYADGFFINVFAYTAEIILWGSLLFSIFFFLNRFVFWATTFVFASDRRLYKKTGLIRVLVNEVSFEEIRKTDINYGLLGRFLGYGKLMMDARFVEDTELPYIYHPELFSKLIHHENDLAGDINLSYVTNGMTDKAEKIIPQKDNVKDQVSPMRDQVEFLDYAFSAEEKENLRKSTQEELSSDFEEVVDVSDKDLMKPASTSPKSMKI
jgi:hypothetical protein